MINKIKILNKKIIKCKKCQRLVDFREKIAEEKTKRFKDQKYWGKPITGFGDPKARVVFVGLKHLQLTVVTEQEGYLQVTSLLSFYLNVCLK